MARDIYLDCIRNPTGISNLIFCHNTQASRNSDRQPSGITVDLKNKNKNKKPINRVRDDYRHTDKLEGVVMVLLARYLSVIVFSQAPNIDRYAPEIRLQPFTLTPDL